MPAAERESVLSAVGQTPLVRLSHLPDRTDIELWAKLESHNPGGSSKDRSARRMVEDALRDGVIGPGSVVIESTSGNLGVGLAHACREHGLRLVCVVDSRTDAMKVGKLEALGAEVRVVTEPDPATGDLLTARLALVGQLVSTTPGAWSPDQYSNESNPAAHAETMAEIDDALEGELDWLIVATSTAGTLCGCCDYLTKHGLSTRVVAVDALGSVLFGGKRGVRRLPGLGAGIATQLSQHAWFDRLVRVSELECVVGCRRLLAREAIFAGASTGGITSAFETLAPQLEPGSRCAMIVPDGGEGYLDTVYDDDWVARELGVNAVELEHLVGDEPRIAPAG